jgi:hypothetical protein
MAILKKTTTVVAKPTAKPAAKPAAKTVVKAVAKPAMKATSPKKTYNQDSLKAEVSYRVAQNLQKKAWDAQSSAAEKSIFSEKWANKDRKKSDILLKESGKALSTFNKLTNSSPRDVNFYGAVQTTDAEKVIKDKFGKKKK